MSLIKRPTMKKSLLLNSGGLDSACLAKWLKDKGFYVVSLHIDTNAWNRKQAMASAEETAKKWADEHHILKLDFGKSSTNTDPNSGFTQSCPHISSVMGLMGVTFAKIHNIKEVYIALKAEMDKDFVKKFGDMVGSCSLRVWQAQLLTPMVELKSYQDSLDFAGLEYSQVEYTTSCNFEDKCNKCNKCKERSNLENS